MNIRESREDVLISLCTDLEPETRIRKIRLRIIAPLHRQSFDGRGL